jgi:hypothetical protein
MSAQAQALNALRALIDAQNNFAPVQLYALPSENGLCLAVTSGRTDAVALDMGQTLTLNVTLTSKHTDPALAYETLCAAHAALTRAASLPAGNGWQIVAICTDGAPGYREREGAYWLFSSSLAVTFTAD